MATMFIEDTPLGDEHPPYVIAEIGHNHGGDLDVCIDMFEKAAACGVSAVKLQKRDNKTLFTQAMYDSPYESENAYGPTYGRHRMALEFGTPEYRELIPVAKRLGIHFFATAFDIPSANFCDELDLPAIKIASGGLTNIPLIRHAARLGRPLIISTGGATMEDVRRAHDVVMLEGGQLVLLQCTAAYPCEPKDMNLRVIATYREEFPDAVIGLSDHQNGIALGPAAYALGGRVFEKHFTLDRAARGTDHAFSLEPPGIRRYVRDLARTAEALGDGVKVPLPVELKPIQKMSQSLYAKSDINEGEELTWDNVAFKSPGGGMPPWKLDRFVGRRVTVRFGADEPLSSGDFE